VKYSGIAFDCYGTIVSIGDDRRVTRRLRRQLAGRPPITGASPMVDDVSILDALLMHGVDPVIAREIADDAGIEAASVRPLPGAVEALNAIRAAGADVALVSNLSREYARPLAELFPDIPTVLSFRMGCEKPDPAMFAEARRILGPGSLLMVGDSRRCDHDGAIASGFDAVLIAPGPVPGATTMPSVAALAEAMGRTSS
jgi:FMN phosphatase YigB (HAD superfamily)